MAYSQTKGASKKKASGKKKAGFMPCPMCKSPKTCMKAGRCLKAAKA